MLLKTSILLRSRVCAENTSLRFLRGISKTAVNLNDLNSIPKVNLVENLQFPLKTEITNKEVELDENKECHTFSDLENSKKLDKNVLKGLKLSNFTTFTPVQEKSILPMLNEENGIVVRAKTGTGKTLAFVVPTLQSVFERLLNSKGSKKIHSLVIAPTRDLALQIEAEYKKVLKNLPKNIQLLCKVGLIMGGRRSEINYRFPPAIVIATPGRLEASLRDKRVALSFSHLKYRVYDEADRILDQGFRETLDNIADSLEAARKEANNDSKLKSVLFSATIDSSVSNFAVSTIGKDYKYIDCVDENEPEAHENIAQTLVKTDSIYDSFNGSVSYVVKNMANKGFKSIVFLPTITSADWYHSVLNSAKHKGLIDSKISRSYESRILKLHGKMSQAARDRTVKEFRRTKHGILVCTDVAARGLDFTDVSDVVQMCPSSAVADYTHKIGRTARAGAKGKSILFLSDFEKRYIRALQIERGVEFAEEIEYKDFEGYTDDILTEIGSFEPDVDAFIQTFLGFQKQVTSVYRFQDNRMLEEVIGLYRRLMGDPDLKLKVSFNFVKHVLHLHPRDAEPYFEVPGGFNVKFSNNRLSKRTFMNDSNRESRGNFSRNSSSNSGYGKNFSSNSGYGKNKNFGNRKRF